MPFAKERRGAYRSILLAHPFDELWYRGLVGRVAQAIEDGLGPQVRSYRLASSPPGWTTRAYEYAVGKKRTDTLDFIESGAFGALGILDVLDYYPSLTCDALGTQLSHVGGPDAGVEHVLRWLSAWQENWGVQGLPIGPEASGLLGNVGLVSLDALFKQEGIPFTRYTDDLDIMLKDPERWWPLLPMVRDTLTSVGLALNDAKTKLIETRPQATRWILDPEIEALKEGLAAGRPDALPRCLDALEGLVGAAAPSGRKIRFLARVLRGRGCEEALPLLERDPHLLDSAPRQWARFLRDLRQRNLLDPDWLPRAATQDISERNAVRKAEMLLAAAQFQIRGDVRETVEKLATEPDNPVVLRAAAAEAWSSCEGWKGGRATEAALEVGDPIQRRALIVSLRKSGGRKQRKAITKLRGAAPRWNPTLDWLEAGAPLA